LIDGQLRLASQHPYSRRTAATITTTRRHPTPLARGSLAMRNIELFVKQRAAQLVFILGIIWIIIVVLLIIANPEPGTGNPMN
jgi:hypothetical protein